jgi:excisionase family DNA binding protein
MSLNVNLEKMVAGFPDEASIILPVSLIRSWLETPYLSFEPDLTVADVAEIFGRGPETVRRWIRDGHLRAYRLGKEYRVPRVALADFQAELASPR